MTQINTFGGKSYVVIRPAELQAFLKSPLGPVFRDMVRRGEAVRQRAIQLAPKRTGNLAAHIVKRVGQDSRGPVVLVGVENVKYAIWVHEGAAPHTIEGNPLLAFHWSNGPNGPGTYFFRRVNHPGNKPNRFLVRALSAARF